VTVVIAAEALIDVLVRPARPDVFTIMVWPEMSAPGEWPV
jgi:hypothetical protein